MGVDQRIKKPSTALRRARDLLIRDGWCRNRAHDLKTGHRCALGAIADTTPQDLRLGCWSYLAQEIRRHGPFTLLSESSLVIARYNDQEGRTRRQVIRMFDRAIATAEGRGM